MKAICENIPRNVLVLGFSGSGKDTQIDKLVEKCEYEVIGTGAMFRDAYDSKTPDGLEAYKYWAEGEWVPDELVYKMFEDYLKGFDSNKSWIFSQTVRTVPQVELFDGLLGKFDRELKLVIYFDLSEEEAIERMSLRRFCSECGRDYHLKYKSPQEVGVCDDDGAKLEIRDDDHPEQIKSRINEFNTKTRPVLDVYQERGILLEIDASPSIDEIHENLIRELNKWGETKKK